jgi:hypothetical protein
MDLNPNDYDLSFVSSIYEIVSWNKELDLIFHQKDWLIRVNTLSINLKEKSQKMFDDFINNCLMSDFKNFIKQNWIF